MIVCNNCKKEIEDLQPHNAAEVLSTDVISDPIKGHICNMCIEEIIEAEDYSMYECCFYGCIACSPEKFENQDEYPDDSERV